jgi:hypothetical protein
LLDETRRFWRASKPAVWREWNGGRDRDRTCDPLDVNEVLSR